jgi:competence protein ComEC
MREGHRPQVPLITAAVLAYAAGLLAGYGGAIVWTGAAIALVVAHGATGRDRALVAVVAVAGCLTAYSGHEAAQSCESALLRAQAWRVTLRADAFPGGFVPAQHACGVRVSLSIADGRAPNGATVEVAGTATRGKGSILIADASIRQVGPPGRLVRWRSGIGRSIDQRFGDQAPLARALLIADMRELSPTLRDRWSAAGLSHMLSVSGLHVGLIAVAVSLIAQIAGLGRNASGAVVVSLTAIYVLVIGAPLPAVRAATMLGVSSLSAAIQRPTSAWAVLAVSALLPLLDPVSVLDIGFQLSMAGMVALVASGALVKRWEWLSVGGWKGTLYRSLVASTAATILTAPLGAAVFGRISLVAPISNLVAVPVMAVLQPMLFLAMVLLPFQAAAQFVADACRPLMAVLDVIAMHAATLPGASLAVLADSTSIALSYAAAAAFVVAAVSRFPGQAMLCGCACIAIIVWRPVLPARGGMTEIHMIDVGQGDAIALRTARGRWVLFDAGRDWTGGDAGKRDVVPYLAARGGPLDGFVLSHPHSDHVGGAASAITALGPRWYVDPAFAGTSGSYRSSLLAARQRGARWTRVHPGDSLIVDEVVITWLAPDSAWAETLHDPNDASTVARIRVGEFTMLMTGDTETAGERWLLANQQKRLDVDVLKVAHHGSNTSSTDEFLDAVSPRLALVSVGTGNVYRHPSPSVLEALARRRAITLRTDLHGSIVVRTDGHVIEVEARGQRFALKP